MVGRYLSLELHGKELKLTFSFAAFQAIDAPLWLMNYTAVFPPPYSAPMYHHHPSQGAGAAAAYAAPTYGPPSLPIFNSRGLKRKAQCLTTPSSQPCDLCNYDDPILQVKECGHTFHSRCVNAWPLTACPVCEKPVVKLTVVNVEMEIKTEQRAGKWTKQEEDFVQAVIKAFEDGAFPLANGTPVRLLLAKLLNCSPMRLSKKFQKNALGKRTYRVPKPVREKGKAFRVFFDKEVHLAKQKQLSELEMKFRQHMVLLKKNDSSKHDGTEDLANLSLAVRQFWVTNFIKFALVIGQKVDGIDLSEPQKKS